MIWCNARQPRGSRVGQYRKKKGLSMRRLAGELVMDPAMIAGWEKGNSESGGKIRKRITCKVSSYHAAVINVFL
jgi:transcriptional regulator with XRE-family HTH domain